MGQEKKEHVDICNINNDGKQEFLLDKIYLDTKKTCYVDIKKHEIIYVDENKKTQKDRPRSGPSTKWYRVFLYLLVNNNIFVNGQNAYNYTYSDGENGHEDYFFTIKDRVNDIKKRKWYRKCDNLISVYEANGQMGGEGFILNLSIDLPEALKSLTITNVVYADHSTIIHREKDVERIKEFLKKDAKNIMITGFGGVGKTSLARLLYSELIKEYDRCGWVQYQGNLKKSFLSSSSLYSGITNEEERWIAIKNELDDPSTKKLIVIDNVDRNDLYGQDPSKDKELKGLSSLRGLTVILTSRLKKLSGFPRPYKLLPLGDEAHPEACIDLFHHHSEDRWIGYDAIVEKLVALAGYHTFAIEILAKSARYEESLESYYRNIQEQKFCFPKLEIETDYVEYYATASEQLGRLFNMKERTEMEYRILDYMALLPEGERISVEELSQWFGISVNNPAIMALEQGGWISFREGFSIHPLIKESVLLNHTDKLINEKEVNHIIKAFSTKGYYGEKEHISTVLRKTNIAFSILQTVNIAKRQKQALLYNRLGDYGRLNGLRSEPISAYETALAIYDKLPVKTRNSVQDMYWRALYYYGYMLSYTAKGYKKSIVYLRKALAVAKDWQKTAPETALPKLAQTLDHIGYVMSNQKSEAEAAEEFLYEALKIRKELVQNNDKKSIQEYAWTMDNLGYLLSNVEGRRKEAKEYLAEALKLREMLAGGDLSTEVAWTSSNLAGCDLMMGTNLEEAFLCYLKSIDILKKIDIKSPEVHDASIAYQYNDFAVLLMLMGFDNDLVQEQFLKTLFYYIRLERKYPDEYELEHEAVLGNIHMLKKMMYEKEKGFIQKTLYMLSGARIQEVSISQITPKKGNTMYTELENVLRDKFNEDVTDHEDKQRINYQQIFDADFDTFRFSFKDQISDNPDMNLEKRNRPIR